MENIICPRNSGTARFEATDVSDEEFNLVRNIRILGLVFVTHIVLLLLVAGENTNLANIRAQETLKNSVSEATGPPVIMNVLSLKMDIFESFNYNTLYTTPQTSSTPPAA